MDITTPPPDNRVEEGRKKMDVTKKAKKNNKPMKVVYISNPMKFETSPSKFRDLVQELTGQDASDLPDPTKFIFDTDGCDRVPGNQTVLDAPPKSIGHDDDTLDHGPSSTGQSFEDDHFVPDGKMMLDGFSCFWPCESHGHLDVLRSSYYD